MKLFWLLLHITLLSSLTVRSAEASSDNKSSIDFQAMQKSIVQLTQQIAVDMGKPIGNKPSEQEKSLPSIVPEVKKQRKINRPAITNVLTAMQLILIPIRRVMCGS